MDRVTSEDRLLGGRVVLRQPRQGLRATIDPVLVAAFIPARPGERVLEAGCGSGVAFLCLAARVPGITVVAVEREAVLAELARTNAAANACRAEIVTGDIADRGLARRLGPCDHAFANPPFWCDGTLPNGALRRVAAHEMGRSLSEWVEFLAAAVRHGGTVSLIIPAARFDSAVAALRDAGCGSMVLLPLAPRVGFAAKRVLLRARRGGRGPARLLAPLVLHEADGRFTAAAEEVLYQAGGLAEGIK